MQQRKQVIKLADALEPLQGDELKTVRASARKYLEPHKGGGARIFNDVDAHLLVDEAFFKVWSDFYVNLSTSIDDPDWHEHSEKVLGGNHLETLKKVFPEIPKDAKEVKATDFSFEKNYKGIQKFLDQIIEVGCDKALDKYGYLDIAWTEKLGVTDLIQKPDDIEQIKVIVCSYKEAIFSLLDNAYMEKIRLTSKSSKPGMPLPPDLAYTALSYYRGYYEIERVYHQLEKIIAKRHVLLIQDFVSQVTEVSLMLTEKEIELNNWIADQFMLCYEGTSSPIDTLQLALERCQYMKLKESVLVTVLENFLKAYPARSQRFAIAPILPLSPSLSSSDGAVSPLDLSSPSSPDSSQYSPSQDSDSDVPVQQRVRSVPASFRPSSLPTEKKAEKASVSEATPPVKRTTSLPVKKNIMSFFHRSVAPAAKSSGAEKKKGKEKELAKKLEMFKGKMQLWLADKSKSKSNPQPAVVEKASKVGFEF